MSEENLTFETLDELGRANVGPGVVGHSAYVAETDTWYEALYEGRGLDRWQARTIGGLSVGAGIIRGYRRVFSWDDTDVFVAALSVAIDLGDPLPVGAVVGSVYAEVSEYFVADPAAALVEADVGISAGDDDRFTPRVLNIASGGPLQSQSVATPASNVQLAVTIRSDVNLNTLTAGEVTITVLYAMPILSSDDIVDVEPPP